MHQAIPYRSWLPHRPQPTSPSNCPIIYYEKTPAAVAEASGWGRRRGVEKDDVQSAVSENAVIVFAMRGCCMSHVVRRLLLGLGTNPAVHEVEEDDEVGVVEKLQRINGGKDGQVQFPAVFIGGRLFGGLDRVMASHISGELIPILKEAGALWL